MVKTKHQLILVCIVILSLFFGCKKDDDTTTITSSSNNSLSMFKPRGTISGLVRDRITNQPVEGAVVSVGFEGDVKTTTSNVAGAYSFADVPAGQYQIINGTSVLTGTYTLTVSLVNYNKSQTDESKKYRDFYYTTVTIKFTSLTPGDSFAVNNLVGSTVLSISHLNTSLSGRVVDVNAQPVANATVMLFDATVFPQIILEQTKTSANGSYQFSKIDNGLTVNVKAQSSDGSLEGAIPALFALPANANSDSLRTQVNVESIILTPVDNVSPFVISVSPENQSDVSPASLKVVYKFSEPIKQTAYTRTDLPAGHSTIVDDIIISYNGFKKTAGNLGFSVQWDTTYTQLTITPQGILGSSKYTVNMTTAFNSGKITDAAGLVLVNNANITGDFEALQFTTNGGTTVPAAPTVTRRIVAGLFGDLDYTGGTVGLQWSVNADARSYNIYRSINGGTFDLLQKDFFGTQFSTNTGSLVNPSGANNPLSAINVRYLVRAVSKDLVESPESNIITVTDAVKPKLVNATVAAGAGTNNWIYTVRFSEPLAIAAAENVGNYSFSNGSGVFYTVNKANYLGLSVGAYVVQLEVSSSAAPVAGYILLAGNGVTDLAGLGVDATSNSKTF